MIVVNKMVPKLKQHFENFEGKNAWDRGVNEYVLELIYDLEENYNDTQVKDRAHLMRLLLNGASNWNDYSYGGCSLIYDEDIVKRLCTPSFAKRKRYGKLDPNRQDKWLDIQKYALMQAAMRLTMAWNLDD